jgi:hypothetical protein
MSQAKTNQVKPATVKAQRAASGVEIEWTAAEVAAYLACSKRLVYLLCQQREIPHRRIEMETEKNRGR